MTDNSLEALRKEIDRIDLNLISLFAERFRVVSKIGNYKKEQNIPAYDHRRWKMILESRLKIAENLGLDTDFIRNIYELIHKYALELEQ